MRSVPELEGLNASTLGADAAARLNAFRLGLPGPSLDTINRPTENPNHVEAVHPRFLHSVLPTNVESPALIFGYIGDIQNQRGMGPMFNGSKSPEAGQFQENRRENRQIPETCARADRGEIHARSGAPQTGQGRGE